MTKLLNNVLYATLAAVGILAAIPTETLDFVPVKYKPWVIAAVTTAGWLKGHKNLFVNPNGTSALTAWVKEDDSKKVQ